MNIYKEITTDNGYSKYVTASNNNAIYILTSSRGKDMYQSYLDKYDRLPSSKWYNRHFSFERVSD